MPPCEQGLGQRFVGILHAGVFADDGNGHAPSDFAHPLVDDVPALQLRRNSRLDAERRQHLVVESGGMIRLGHGVDVVDVARLDHSAFTHVAEQTELRRSSLGIGRSVRQSNVRLDADRAQFLTECWVGFCLQFARAGENGNSVR